MMHYVGQMYIVCSNNRNVLYTGVTSALRKRIHQHKTNITETFGLLYNIGIRLLRSPQPHEGLFTNAAAFPVY